MNDHHTAEKDETPRGWQQPPTPPVRSAPRCPHLGLLFANLSAYRHTEGHEWVCGCGQVFVVVSNGGRDKRLVPTWRKPANPAAKTGDAKEAR